MQRRLIWTILVFLIFARPLCALTLNERREYLDKLLQTLPDTPSWQKWLQTSGELPPDFDALPRNNSLPDPLHFLDGRPVHTPEEWLARRAEIKQLFEKYVFGTFPPHPKLSRVTVLDEARGEDCIIRHARLEFGPENRGTLRVELFIPDGRGPFPVLFGPAWMRGWAQLAVRRGYLCAMYAGSDSQDDADALAALYPQYDFALLPRRAWAGTLTLDYLKLVPEANMEHVGLAGHSRDGKQALIEAGLDERITAVAAMSTGVGGTLPYRLSGERAMGEGLEATTRRFPTWFHPRLRFFVGREDRLPVDGNLLVALVAPRACLISFGVHDSVSDPWSDEQSYLSALKVYRFLGQPENLGLQWRYGLHAVSTEDAERMLDWFDIQFGRSDRTWHSDRLFNYDFEAWRTRSGESVNLTNYPAHGSEDILKPTGSAITTPGQWERKAAIVRQSVEWMLGKRPPRMPTQPMDVKISAGTGTNNPPAPSMLDDLPGIAIRAGEHAGWRKPESDLVEMRRGIRFGDGATGDLYWPKATPPDAKLPVVIWLHGYGYPMGYEWEYRSDLSPILALVKAGYAVFAFDQTGFGRRIFEAQQFYERFPRWSQFGRMVEDTRAAMDALEHVSLVDPQRIYLFGYSIGATVGIYTAALDARVQGLVAICGFTPMRSDTAERGAGGVARYSHEHGLIPRLGFFVGHEAQIPYDFDELLGAIAPRPVLVMQPQLDRDANVADVRAAIAQAAKVYGLYGATDKLALYDPWDYNRLPEASQDWLVNWMTSNLRPKKNL